MHFLAALPLLALAQASPLSARSHYALKETHPVPRGWSRAGPAPANHIVRLNIGLRQGNFDELERHLYEVSDPEHERYGEHLSSEEVTELIKPDDESLNLVVDWLNDNGIDKSRINYSPAKDWINIVIPINAAEALLDTEYSVWEHDTDGDLLVRTPNWSLPRHLHEHIDVIQPTNSFFRARQQASTVKIASDDVVASAPLVQDGSLGVSSVCNASAVTPLCLRTLYGTIDYVPQVPGLNKVALTDYLGESNNRSDVRLFLQNYRPEAVAAADQFQVQIIANGNDEQGQENSTELKAGKDLEGNLDAETIIGITWPTPLIAYTTGGSPPFVPDVQTPTNENEPYLTWIQYVLAQQDLPQAVSTSYADDEQTIPYSYAKSVCNGFAQLGARGVSLFFGSGDNGVGAEGDCVSNDGTNSTTYLSMFPSSCPFITSVGGTKNFDPEEIATDTRNGYVSGSGFSRYFPRPAYQNTAVSAYLETIGDLNAGLFNASGRAYPDVAAQGYHYVTIWNGTLVPLDGTSAATPTFASVISLVNDALLAEGKPPLGFLNPWLYKSGYKAFTDITTGNSTGCGTGGFPATKGWDAASGFGTPNFKKLVNRACKRGGQR